MSQIVLGKVSVTSSSTLVVGNENADWTNVVADDLFIVDGESDTYEVASTVSPASSSSGFWELILNENYNGNTRSDLSYVIHQDFSVNHRFPLVNKGYVSIAPIVSKALIVLDTLFNNNEVPTIDKTSGDGAVTIEAANLSQDSQVMGISLPLKAYFLKFYLKKISGGEITGFKIGTTSGGDEILPSVNLPDSVGALYDLLPLVLNYGSPQPTIFGTDWYVSADSWGTGEVSLEASYVTIALEQSSLS